MLEKVLQLLNIKCRHSRTSQPFTASTAAASNGPWEPVSAAPSHYVVCLECGMKFSYDWNRMRIVR